MNHYAAFLFVLCWLFALRGNLAAGENQAYGNHNLREILVSQTDADGNVTHAINLKHLDLILSDLQVHTHQYPPHFANVDDKQRAISDAKILSRVFDGWIASPDISSDKQLLFKAAVLYSLSCNLDVAGSFDRANTCYKMLVKLEPENPLVRYRFGIFLAGAGQSKRAIPQFEKAVSLGLDAALFSLGMSHLTLNDTAAATKSFVAYREKYPDDERTKHLLDAIARGKIKTKVVRNELR